MNHADAEARGARPPAGARAAAAPRAAAPAAAAARPAGIVAAAIVAAGRALTPVLTLRVKRTSA